MQQQIQQERSETKFGLVIFYIENEQPERLNLKQSEEDFNNTDCCNSLSRGERQKPMRCLAK